MPNSNLRTGFASGASKSSAALPGGSRRAETIDVIGGYLERLPLAALNGGLPDCAEIWTHRRGAIAS